MKIVASRQANRSSSRLFAIISVLILLFVMVPVAQGTSGDTVADAVLGQPGFITNQMNYGWVISASGLSRPESVAVSPTGRVFVADSYNSRVLSWPNTSTLSNGQAADLVLGQVDLTTIAPTTTPLSARTLRNPYSVAVDGSGRLFVADHGNNRVLRFSPPFSNYQAADLVIGQVDFVSNSDIDAAYYPTAHSLYAPVGVAVDQSDNLFVAEYYNHRVLRYSVPFSNGQAADLVLGQPNFTSNVDNNGGISEKSLSAPFSVAVDVDGNVLVTDLWNNRVQRFSAPLSNFKAADIVIGQPNSTSKTSNNGGVSARSLSLPRDLIFDSSGNLFVADAGNNRVLRYSYPLSSNQAADLVFGQSNFTTGLSNGGGVVSASSLAQPHGVAFDTAGNLFVADYYNNRVLKYDLAPNQPPTALDRSASGAEDSAIIVVLSAADPDGDALTYSIGIGPFNGAVSLAGNIATYTPAANYNGPDSFTYRVFDGAFYSNEAIVSVSVTPVNDAPVCESLVINFPEDTVVTRDLSGQCTDMDGDSIPIELVALSLHGTSSLVGTTLTYTPRLNYNGPDSVTFKVNDGKANSNIATVSIQVTPVNDEPLANSQSVTTAEDTAKAIILSVSDVDTDALIFSLVSGPSHGWLSGAAPNLIYTPSVNYSGSDSFTFKANDGTADSNVGTVNVTVTPVNDAPTISDIADQITFEDTTLGPISFTLGDIDTEMVSLSLTGTSSNLALVPNSAIGFGGSGANRTVSITPVPNQNGTAKITINVDDGSGGTASDSFLLTVNAVNDPPTAIAGGPYAGNEGSPIILSGSGSDPDIGDTLLYSWSFGDGTLPTPFSPDPLANHVYADDGVYTVDLTVKDSQGATGSGSSTVTVSNLPPSVTIIGAPLSSPEGTAINLTGAVVDPGSTDTFTSYLWSATKNGIPYASHSGTNFGFIPNDNGIYGVTLRVTDDDGGVGSDNKIINVTNVSPTVTIIDAPGSVPEGSVIRVTAEVVEPSEEDILTYRSLRRMADEEEIVRIVGGGAYIAAFYWVGGTDEVFVVDLEVTDDDGGVGRDSKIIRIDNVNPTAAIEGAPASVLEGTTISLTSNVTDPGTQTFTYSWSVTKNGAPYASGSNSNFSFTPDDDGTYVATLVAMDGRGGSGTDSKAIQVTNVTRTDPIISWSNPSDIVHGTALSGAQLNATASVPGAFVYTPAAGTLLNADNGQVLSVQFTPTDQARYNSVGKTVQINVLKASPTVNWSNPADIIFGTPLGSDQLNATATFQGTPLTGSFTYSPTAGTVLNPGSGQRLDATFSPSNAQNFNVATASVQINVLYRFGGFGQPAAGLKPSKMGSTIPLKFQLFRADGGIVSNAVAGFQVYKVQGGSSSSLALATPSRKELFRYDATDRQYIYNFNSKVISSFRGGEYVLVAQLDDGTSREVRVNLN